MRLRHAIAAAALTASLAGGAIAASAETLTVSVTGRGTVTSTPRGIACPPKCRAVLARGRSVALIARARPGWRFGGWSGGCRSQTNPRCVVWLRAAKRVHARFRANVPPPPPPPTPRPTFAPQALAGTWSGTWRNNATGASGAASIRFQVPDATTFVFTLTLGTVFGCNEQPAVVSVVAGSGPNTWNANGFNVQVTGSPSGSFTLTYETQAQTLIGTGRSGCAPDTTWELRGTFAAPTFTGTLSVARAGTTTAFALDLTRPAPP